MEEAKKKRKSKTSYEVKHRYEQKAMKQYRAVFHKVSDADIIKALEEAPNKTDLIRKALRAYLASDH